MSRRTDEMEGGRGENKEKCFPTWTLSKENVSDGLKSEGETGNELRKLQRK